MSWPNGHNSCVISNTLFTALFTVEYLLRLYCSPKTQILRHHQLFGCRWSISDSSSLPCDHLPWRFVYGRGKDCFVSCVSSASKIGSLLTRFNILLRSTNINGKTQNPHLLWALSVSWSLSLALWSLLLKAQKRLEYLAFIEPSKTMTITTVGYSDLDPSKTALGKAITFAYHVAGLLNLSGADPGIITAGWGNEMNSHKRVG